jgi:hypothetical protein
MRDSLKNLLLVVLVVVILYWLFCGHSENLVGSNRNMHLHNLITSLRRVRLTASQQRALQNLKSISSLTPSDRNTLQQLANSSLLTQSQKNTLLQLLQPVQDLQSSNVQNVNVSDITAILDSLLNSPILNQSQKNALQNLKTGSLSPPDRDALQQLAANNVSLSPVQRDALQQAMQMRDRDFLQQQMTPPQPTSPLVGLHQLPAYQQLSSVMGNITGSDGQDMADLTNYYNIKTRNVSGESAHFGKLILGESDVGQDIAQLKQRVHVLPESATFKDLNISGNLVGNSGSLNSLMVGGEDVNKSFDVLENQIQSVYAEVVGINARPYVLPDSVNLKNANISGNLVMGSDNSRILASPRKNTNCPYGDIFNNMNVQPNVTQQPGQIKDIGTCTNWCVRNAGPTLANATLTPDGTCWCKNNGCSLMPDPNVTTQQII